MIDRYADYAFYLDELNGKMSEEEFLPASLYATFYIREITLGRSDNYEGCEVKLAMCAVADVYKSVYGSDGMSSGGGTLKSENTDGYSVSYATEAVDGQRKEDLFRAKAIMAARTYLARTGLLNRRVSNIDHKW